ncbi:hypothetical protein ACFQZZ_32795 [Nocardia sp. GCM10030253]|uniref:hypothetical protein n=1 Tax=Nocardia sp. GCM10030253 TaxID=3273404 RepID=UPI0036394707
MRSRSSRVGSVGLASNSRIEDIVDGKLARTEVDLLDIGDSSARAPRNALEELGIRINYLPIGQPLHVNAALDGDRPIAPYVIVSCHGDIGSILLPELGGDIADAQPFTDRMGPDQVRKHLRIPGSVVIPTGCETGEPALARAFLEVGARSYFAPTEIRRPHGVSRCAAAVLRAD